MPHRYHARVLAGRVVLVTGGGSGIGEAIALGLRDAGATVAVTDGPIASREDADRAFAEAAESTGSLDAVVHALVDPEALVAAPLAETDPASWDGRCEAVLRAALWCCQAAHDALRGRGGRIVFVTPTVGLTGGAGLVPYATAVEGMRALAKTAARQWGGQGIAVNCVAPPVELVGPASGPDVAVPALGRLPDARTDVAPVVATLVGDAFVTGTTVVVDGGMVMAP
jgi:NAD(P)-dependent dehydrogenase (short-subunit alcohol dehydrogenase family)